MMFYLDTFLAEAEESSSGVDLLLPATSELVAGVVAFGVVFFFVWKWALPALNETLDKRSSEIEAKTFTNGGNYYRGRHCFSRQG